MRQELGTAGRLALPRGCLSLVPPPAAGDLTWHCTGVSLVLWTGSATLSPTQVNAQLASLGTRLSCSSLIYYKGDGDKQPREPLKIQCPCRSCPSRPQSGHVTGSQRWNFCRVCFIRAVGGVFFSSCPVYWRAHRVRMRPRSRVGNVSLLSSRVHITGTCYTPGPRPGIRDLALALAL